MPPKNTLNIMRLIVFLLKNEMVLLFVGSFVFVVVVCFFFLHKGLDFRNLD